MTLDIENALTSMASWSIIWCWFHKLVVLISQTIKQHGQHGHVATRPYGKRSLAKNNIIKFNEKKKTFQKKVLLITWVWQDFSAKQKEFHFIRLNIEFVLIYSVWDNTNLKHSSISILKTCFNLNPFEWNIKVINRSEASSQSKLTNQFSNYRRNSWCGLWLLWATNGNMFEWSNSQSQ